MPYIWRTICLMLTIMVYSSAGILFDTPCMAPPPCICSQDRIQCYSKHFTSIPKFQPSAITMTNLTIMLPGNDLTIIPANAFMNINTTGASAISIMFQSNDLYQMDLEAFSGIENAVVELCLEDNKFKTIPAALTRLTNLKRVHMQANPLITIDPLIMSQMSSSLEDLAFSGENLVSWPNGLSYLHNLNYLTILPIQISFPIDAFFGLTSLKELYVAGSPEYGTPTAVCFLHNLQKLYIYGYECHTTEEFSRLQEKCKQAFANVNRFMHI